MSIETMLKEAGYTVVSGCDAVLGAIKELSDGSTEILCSGYGVLPDGKRCDGCADCDKLREGK